MKWILTDPSRYLLERAELERLASEVDWLSYAWRIGTDSSVEADVDLVVHGRTYAGRLTYPAIFPNSPPYIRPRDPAERWSTHQYGAGGSLCLQWRADNWQPHVTGAELVRSAFELLQTEKHPDIPAIAPSDHRLTVGQALRSKEYRFIATQALMDTLEAKPDVAAIPVSTCTVAHKSATIRYVTKVGDEGRAAVIADLPVGLTTYSPLFSWAGKGWLLRSPTFAEDRDPSTIKELEQWVADAGHDSAVLSPQEPERKLEARLILLSSGAALPKVFAIETTADEPTLKKHYVLSGNSNQARLDGESAALSQKKIGIVGLGSIGSKLAISMARSGVRRFVLVDDDLLLPANMVRHELSWASVGVHKTQATRDALTLVAADVEVIVNTHRLAGQESAVTEATILDELAGCDLLVDATADPEVFLRLAAVAKSEKIPLVWGEVFAGGYGGIIARARPDIDPDPLSVRSALHLHLETLPPAPFRHAIDYDAVEESPFVAHDSDVGHIATALTRLAIDTILMRQPSHFPYPLYLVGLRQEWVFSQPFDTRPVEAHGGNWEHPGTVATSEQQIEALKDLMALQQAYINAHPNSAS